MANYKAVAVKIEGKILAGLPEVDCCMEHSHELKKSKHVSFQNAVRMLLCYI